MTTVVVYKTVYCHSDKHMTTTVQKTISTQYTQTNY